MAHWGGPATEDETGWESGYCGRVTSATGGRVGSQTPTWGSWATATYCSRPRRAVHIGGQTLLLAPTRTITKSRPRSSLTGTAARICISCGRTQRACCPDRVPTSRSSWRCRQTGRRGRGPTGGQPVHQRINFGDRRDVDFAARRRRAAVGHLGDESVGVR
jgi:hypothetical protein